jgi:predicted MPP superfamily phosphohydrolase
MSCQVKMPYFTTGSIILLILLMFIPNQVSHSQSSEELSSATLPTETIKIANPITTQNVSTGGELIISGVSSDNTLKDCSISVIVNDVRPYQIAIAKGTGGINDFSQWEFVLRTSYTQIIEGENKITSKLTCSSAPPRWYSVFVNGVSNNGNEEISPPAPVESEGQPNIPVTNLSEIADTEITDTEITDNINNVLSVSILPQKNPVARGDSQNITITVTDSASRAVPNVEISGNLIYPGENFEKEFTGITDPQGKFVYSWIIGENGDVGPLSIELEVSSEGFSSTSVTGSFEVVDSSEASGINNPRNDSIGNLNSGFEFVIAGDYGCDSVSRQTLESMEEKDPDLVFALGDLSEVKNPQCFFDIVSELNDDGRFKITLGEHDTDSNNSNNTDSSSRYGQYIRHFNLESPFYAFDHQNVHFLAMSTGKSLYFPYVNGSAQYNFINDDLSKAANNPNIDWIIVYGYRPFYTSPTIHPSNEILRVTYPPLFEKYGVDLVVTSHNHNYQRSYPLVYNTENTRQPIIKDVNASHYFQPNVPIYVNVGTAGSNLYDFRAQAPFIATQFKVPGFLQVNISSTDQDILTGRFHNIGNGTYIDQFMITKSEIE